MFQILGALNEKALPTNAFGGMGAFKEGVELERGREREREKELERKRENREMVLDRERERVERGKS